jgi:predicted nucleic acid-binding protein
MASVVIDASIASAWCFPDEKTDYTQAILSAITASMLDALAPSLWAYEVRNSVLMALRRGRIAKPDGDAFLQSLNELNVSLSEPVSLDTVFALAETHVLTFYDAAYLNVALAEGLPLASLDKQLLRAAAQAGVEFFEP